MQLSDTHGWTPDTALEHLALEGQDLGSYQAFWDRSAKVDAIRAIADQDSDESFMSSGVEDAEGIRPLLAPDGAFLEIGCGIGRVLQHVASMCREVHGVDISAEMIQRGQQRLRHLPNVRFHQGNGYDLAPFQSNIFDVVYCAFVFQHMPKTSVFNYCGRSTGFSSRRVWSASRSRTSCSMKGSSPSSTSPSRTSCTIPIRCTSTLRPRSSSSRPGLAAGWRS